MGTINMRVLILTGTLLLVQLSQQAAVPEAAEVAFPDGNVEEVAAKDYDYYVYGYPYYLCKCSFEEYEEYWGVASVDVDTEETAWCPCFQYDSYEYQGVEYEYAYEADWPSQPREEEEAPRRPQSGEEEEKQETSSLNSQQFYDQ